MAWLLRGLVDGVVTTRWPARSDPYQAEWPSNLARVHDASAFPAGVSSLCPTGAIEISSGPRVVQERCIGCGACVRAHPEAFEFERGSAQARLVRTEDDGTPEDLARLRSALLTRTRALGRSVHLRHVDAGSDGSEEWEINALLNPDYDIHRLGIFFTASPRHADILLVTGIGATGMLAPMRRTWDGMPDPKVVIAVGTDACSGGVFAGSYAGSDGIGGSVDVDVWVPGAPPTPFAILYAVLLATGRIQQGGPR